LSVNHPTIDKQHQELFFQLNDLNQSICRREDDSVVKIMNFLEVHVNPNFEAEEPLIILTM